jgi:hypothetical protein
LKLLKRNCEVQQQKKRGGVRATLGLYGIREQAFRRPEHHFTPTLFQHAAALPLTNQAARSKGSDVRSIRQIFIDDIEDNSTHRFFANRTAERN